MINPKPILLCTFGKWNQLQSEFMVPESRGISTTSIVNRKLTMAGTTTYNYVTGDKGSLDKGCQKNGRFNHTLHAEIKVFLFTSN